MHQYKISINSLIQKHNNWIWSPCSWQAYQNSAGTLDSSPCHKHQKNQHTLHAAPEMQQACFHSQCSWWSNVAQTSDTYCIISFLLYALYLSLLLYLNEFETQCTLQRHMVVMTQFGMMFIYYFWCMGNQVSTLSQFLPLLVHCQLGSLKNLIIICSSIAYDDI